MYNGLEYYQHSQPTLKHSEYNREDNNGGNAILLYYMNMERKLDAEGIPSVIVRVR